MDVKDSELSHDDARVLLTIRSFALTSLCCSTMQIVARLNPAAATRMRNHPNTPHREGHDLILIRER